MKLIKRTFIIALAVCMLPFSATGETSGGYKYGDQVKCTIGDLSYESYSLSDSQIFSETSEGGSSSDINIDESDTEYNFTSLLFNAEDGTIEINGVKYPLKGYVKETTGLADITRDLLGDAAEDANVKIFGQTILIDGDLLSDLFKSSDFIGKISNLLDPSDYESLKTLAETKFGENEGAIDSLKENWDKILDESTNSFKNLDLDELWEKYMGELYDTLQDFEFDWKVVDDAVQAKLIQDAKRAQEISAENGRIIADARNTNFDGKFIPYEGNQAVTTYSSVKEKGAGCTYETGGKDIKITLTTESYRDERDVAKNVSTRLNDKETKLDNIVGMLSTGKIAAEGKESAIYNYANKIKRGEETFTSEGFAAAFESDIPLISAYMATQDSSIGGVASTREMLQDNGTGFIATQERYIITEEALKNNTYVLPFTDKEKETMINTINYLQEQEGIAPGLTAYSYDESYNPFTDIPEVTEESEYYQVDTDSIIDRYNIIVNQITPQDFGAPNTKDKTAVNHLRDLSYKVLNGQISLEDAKKDLENEYSERDNMEIIVEKGMEYINGELQNSKKPSITKEIYSMQNVMFQTYSGFYFDAAKNEDGTLTAESVGNYGINTDGVMEITLHIPSTDENAESLLYISTATQMLENGSITVNDWANIVKACNIKDDKGNPIDFTSLSSAVAFCENNQSSNVKTEISTNAITDSEGYRFNAVSNTGVNDPNYMNGATDLHTLIVACRKKEYRETHPNWTEEDMLRIEKDTSESDIEYLRRNGVEINNRELYVNGQKIEGATLTTVDDMKADPNTSYIFAGDTVTIGAGLNVDGNQTTTSTGNILEGIFDYSSMYRKDWEKYIDGRIDLSNTSTSSRYNKEYNNYSPSQIPEGYSIKPPEGTKPAGYTDEEWEDLWEETSYKSTIKENKYALYEVSMTHSDGKIHYYPTTGKGLIIYNPENGTIYSAEHILEDKDAIRYAVGTQGYFPGSFVLSQEEKDYINFMQTNLLGATISVSLDPNSIYVNDKMILTIGKYLAEEKLGLPEGTVLTCFQPEELGEGKSDFYFVLDYGGALESMTVTLNQEDYIRHEIIDGKKLCEILNIKDPRDLERYTDKIVNEAKLASETESTETNGETSSDNAYTAISNYAKYLAEWYYEDAEDMRKKTSLDSYDMIEPFLKIASELDGNIKEKYTSEKEELRKEIERSQSEDGTEETKEEIISDIIEFLKNLGFTETEIPTEITYEWLKENIGVEEIVKFFSTHVLRLERYVKVKVEDITIKDNESLEHRNFPGGQFEWTVASSNGEGDSTSSTSGGGKIRTVVLRAKVTSVTAKESIVRRRSLVTSYSMEETIVLEPFGWEVSRKTVSGTGINGEPNASSKKTIISTGTRTVFNRQYIIDDETGGNGGGNSYWIDENGNVIGDVYGDTDGTNGTVYLPWAEFIKNIKNQTGYWVNGYGHDIIEGWAVLVITPHGTNNMSTYRIK